MGQRMGGDTRGGRDLLEALGQGGAVRDAARDRFIDEFLSHRMRFGAPTENDRRFDQTQTWLNGNSGAAAAAGLIQLRITPWAEQSRLRASLLEAFNPLAQLHQSAQTPAIRPGALLQMQSTIQCHRPPQRETPTQPPSDLGDLRPPTPTQAIADAMATRAISLGNQQLTGGDRTAFQTAITALGSRAGISVQDRTHILANLCVLLSPGTQRPLNDATCGRLALGLAQALAHPPAGATGDLQLAQSNPRALAEYVSNLATRGSSARSQSERRELSTDGRQQVADARTPQEALDRLLGASRTVIPNVLDFNLTGQDDPRANVPLSDEAIRLLRAMREGDSHLRTIRVTHQANGDDLVDIAFDAAHNVGDGPISVSVAQNVRMTVHRNADNSVELRNINGLTAPLTTISQIDLGQQGAANRTVTAHLTWGTRNVTDECPYEQFDQIVDILNGINRNRR